MSDSAWINLATMVATICGFLTLWIKLHYGARQSTEIASKIDDNTAITIGSARQIDRKLNGGLDTAVHHVVAPLKQEIEQLKSQLEVLTSYVHQRHHELADGIQTMKNQISVLIEKEVKGNKENP